MNQVLELIFDDFLDIMKEQKDVLGAWNFGSSIHGLSDEYSDVDVIFWVEGHAFEQVDRKISNLLEKACDEIVVCWPEVFNNEAITNYGYLLKRKNALVQFDVFLLNADKLDDFMCRVHYMDLKQENVLFDRAGDVKKLIENAPKGEVWNSDLEALQDTYWFHANMTIKYLKRKDFFKLEHVMRILMDTHISLLLTGYDQITWGGMANKLHFIPEENQKHVMSYACVEDFETNIHNLWTAMNWFQEDYKDVCSKKQVVCQDEISEQIKQLWKIQIL